MQSSLAVFTVTTEPEHPGLKRLCRSATRHDIPLVVYNQPQVGRYDKFLRQKHLFIYETLKTLACERFLFLDAWDTYFSHGLSTQMLNTDTLCFGAEKNCYPLSTLEPRYTTQGLPFPYLNSGVIWGPKEEYLKYCPLEVEHDQLAWTKEYLNGHPILLDHKAEWVLNLHSTKDEDLARFKDGVRYVPTGTWPAILHGNGKWPLPNWLEE